MGFGVDIEFILEGFFNKYTDELSGRRLI